MLPSGTQAADFFATAFLTGALATDLVAAFPTVAAASLEAVLDNIDRIRDLAGVEHIGVGSDFDGVNGMLATGLKSVADYPVLVAGLKQRGYSDKDVRAILGGNLLRVWKAVEEGAAH